MRHTQWTSSLYYRHPSEDEGRPIWRIVCAATGRYWLQSDLGNTRGCPQKWAKDMRGQEDLARWTRVAQGEPTTEDLIV